jgi:hypothetical protein
MLILDKVSMESILNKILFSKLKFSKVVVGLYQ